MTPKNSSDNQKSTGAVPKSHQKRTDSQDKSASVGDASTQKHDLEGNETKGDNKSVTPFKDNKKGAGSEEYSENQSKQRGLQTTQQQHRRSRPQIQFKKRGRNLINQSNFALEPYSQFIETISERFPSLRDFSPTKRQTILKLGYILQTLLKTNTMVRETNNNEVIVNSTSLEDVTLSETNSVDRAQSVTSIDSTSTKLSASEIQLLEARLNESQKNIREMKQKQLDLLKMQKTVASFLEDLENSRAGHTSSDTPPDFQSVEDIHDHMANLVKRMKQLKTMVQRQAEFAEALGEDGGENNLVSEQNAILQQWEGIFDRHSEMENLMCELQETESLKKTDSSNANGLNTTKDGDSTSKKLKIGYSLELTVDHETEDKSKENQDDISMMENIDRKLSDIGGIKNNLLLWKLYLKRGNLISKDIVWKCLTDSDNWLTLANFTKSIPADTPFSDIEEIRRREGDVAAQSEKVRRLSKMTEELRRHAEISKNSNQVRLPKAYNLNKLDANEISKKSSNTIKTTNTSVDQEASLGFNELPTFPDTGASNLNCDQTLESAELENTRHYSLPPNKITSKDTLPQTKGHPNIIESPNNCAMANSMSSSRPRIFSPGCPENNDVDSSILQQLCYNQSTLFDYFNRTEQMFRNQQRDIDLIAKAIGKVQSGMMTLNTNSEVANRRQEDSVPLNCVQNNLFSGITGSQSSAHYGGPAFVENPFARQFGRSLVFNKYNDPQEPVPNNRNHSSIGDIRQPDPFVPIVPTRQQNRSSQSPSTTEPLNEHFTNQMPYYPTFGSFNRNQNSLYSGNNISSWGSGNQSQQQPQQYHLPHHPSSIPPQPQSYTKSNQTVGDNSSSALNNQVPPGNRTNNYWDNFRSYSTQNLLSGSHKNETHNQQISVNPVREHFEMFRRNSMNSKYRASLLPDNSGQMTRERLLMGLNPEVSGQALNGQNNFINNRPLNIETATHHDEACRSNKQSFGFMQRPSGTQESHELIDSTMNLHLSDMRNNTNINNSYNGQKKLPPKTATLRNYLQNYPYPAFQQKAKSNDRNPFNAANKGKPSVPSNTVEITPRFTSRDSSPGESTTTRRPMCNNISDTLQRMYNDMFPSNTRNDNIGYSDVNNQNMFDDYGEGACGHSPSSELFSLNENKKRNFPPSNPFKYDKTTSEQAKDLNNSVGSKKFMKFGNYNQYAETNNFERIERTEAPDTNYENNTSAINGSPIMFTVRDSLSKLPYEFITKRRDGDNLDDSNASVPLTPKKIQKDRDGWILNAKVENLFKKQLKLMHYIIMKVGAEIDAEPITDRMKIRVAELTASIMHNVSLEHYKLSVDLIAAQRIYTDMTRLNSPDTYIEFLEWYENYLEQVFTYGISPDEFFNLSGDTEPSNPENSATAKRYSSELFPPSPIPDKIKFKRKRYIPQLELKPKNQYVSRLADKNSNNSLLYGQSTTDNTETNCVPPNADYTVRLLEDVSERLVLKNNVTSARCETDICLGSSTNLSSMPENNETEILESARNDRGLANGENDPSADIPNSNHEQNSARGLHRRQHTHRVSDPEPFNHTHQNGSNYIPEDQIPDKETDSRP